MKLQLKHLLRRIKTQRQMLLMWGACWLVVLVITGFINHDTSTRRSVDLFFYDMLLRYKPVVQESQIAVIEIDDNSFASLGQWPWSRAHHAQLVNQINRAEPKALFFDILFTEPGRDSFADEQLAAAFKGSPKVVLPVLLAPKQGGLLDLSDLSQVQVYDPISIFSRNVQIGHVGNQPDWDSVVRHASRALHIDGRNLKNVMALMADKPLTDPVSAQELLIPYRGISGQFSHYSYIDVLEGRVPPEMLRGKYVLVGASASGLGDISKTPFGLMPGVEIHANTLSAILQGDFITPVSPQVQLVFELLLVSIIMVGFLLLGERLYLLNLLIVVAFIIFLSVYLLYEQSIWLSPVVAVLMVVVAYIVWSWWQMYTTFRYLRLQLAGLMPDLVGIAGHRWIGKFEKTQNIIYKLESAQEEKKQTDLNNRELVEFLSHDMRTPQVNILAALSVFKEAPDTSSLNVLFEKIEQNVANTLSYAQSLIDLNRIQKVALNLEELNLLHLVSHARERIYVQAQRKNIRIELICDEATKEMAWIRADGALMERALLNLMSNAIRYSPEFSVVQVSLSIEYQPDGAFVLLSVADQGKGMDSVTKTLLLSGKGVKNADKQVLGDGQVSLGVGWRIIHSIIVKKHHGILDIDITRPQGLMVLVKLPLNIQNP